MQARKAIFFLLAALVLGVAPLGFGQEASTTPTTGTIIFNFTITMKTPMPKNGVLTCSSAAAVIETSYSADEGQFGIGKFVSGTTYSCSTTINYSWLLSTASTDKIVLSYKAQVNVGIEATATNGTGTVVAATAGRFSSQTTASIPVPASGATTTKDVSITL